MLNMLYRIETTFFCPYPLEYESVGARLVDKKSAFQSDIVLKVRAPQPKEATLFRDQVPKTFIVL